MSSPQIGDIWFRYYDGRDRIELAEMTVIKVTKMCVLLYECPGRPPWDLSYLMKYAKRVLQDPHGRRHAYQTRELAANSYRRRKSFQRKYMEASMKKLELMESMMGAEGDIPPQPEPELGKPFFTFSSQEEEQTR